MKDGQIVGTDVVELWWKGGRIMRRCTVCGNRKPVGAFKLGATVCRRCDAKAAPVR